jgi:hypothetical protein
MKQTLEEAASKELFSSYACTSRSLSFEELVYDRNAMLNMFRKGAEWHAKQSPWIKTKERLPEDTSEKIVMLVDGTIRIAHYDEDYNEDMEYHFWYDCAASESYHRDDVIYWMPIPSFDEILESNRDVLERIKEKGD